MPTQHVRGFLLNSRGWSCPSGQEEVADLEKGSEISFTDLFFVCSSSGKMVGPTPVRPVKKGRWARLSSPRVLHSPRYPVASSGPSFLVLRRRELGKVVVEE